MLGLSGTVDDAVCVLDDIINDVKTGVLVKLTVILVKIIVDRFPGKVVDGDADKVEERYKVVLCGIAVELLNTNADRDNELVSLIMVVLLGSLVGRVLDAWGVGVAAAARRALCLTF